MKTPLLFVNCKCVCTISMSRVSHIEGQHVTQCSLNQWKNTLTCLRSAVSSVSQQSVPRSADWIRTWTFPPSATPLFSFRSKHMFVRQASGSLRFRLDTEGECWCEHFFCPHSFKQQLPRESKYLAPTKYSDGPVTDCDNYRWRRTGTDSDVSVCSVTGHQQRISFTDKR